MKSRFTILAVALAWCVFGLTPSCFARGFGAARGGFAGGRAGAVGGYRSSGASFGAYGGSHYGTRSARSVVGPVGGSRTTRSGSGTYTTPRGGSIQYGGASGSRTGPYGGSTGRYVGGVHVNTAGGRTATKVGTGAGAVGPGGRAVGTRSSVGAASGPYGSRAGASRTTGAIGPRGATVGRSHTGVGVSPYGVSTRSSRGAVTVGRGGTVAARGTRYGTSRYGTYHVSRASLTTRGTAVRSNFRYYNAFTPTWYARYPSAWRATRWIAPIWAVTTWPTLYTYCGYGATPVYYEYGDNVVYNDNSVYYNGEPVATSEQYLQQATQIADAGQQAQPAPDESWQPLGVFALVRGDEETSTNIFQLAINKSGVIRGNYYDAVSDTTLPLNGSVDKSSQRAAWTVGDKKTPVYETGIANLTKDETTLLVHYDKDNTQQYTLVRVKQPKEGE